MELDWQGKLETTHTKTCPHPRLKGDVLTHCPDCKGSGFVPDPRPCRVYQKYGNGYLVAVGDPSKPHMKWVVWLVLPDGTVPGESWCAQNVEEEKKVEPLSEPCPNCKIVMVPDEYRPNLDCALMCALIQFCPLHAAAPEMLTALQMYEEFKVKYLRNDFPARTEIEAIIHTAIEHALGKPCEILIVEKLRGERREGNDKLRTVRESEG